MPHSELQKQRKQGYLDQHQLHYDEIVSYLDNNWKTSTAKNMQQINAVFSNIAHKTPTITITGTSGKSTTIHYLTELLKTENLTVGVFSSPHFNTYNERFSYNNNLICQETFTKLANKVINTIKKDNINASTHEILTTMALLYFQEKKVDVAILEQQHLDEYDPTTICAPTIIGITRIVITDEIKRNEVIKSFFKDIKPQTYVTSGDQSKILLHKIATLTEESACQWIMPIRKLAPLPYPYEQLHGRCAALAERIAQTYIETALKHQPVNKNSLLRTSKKQRGRPRLTAKQQLLKQPTNNTIEYFWNHVSTSIPNRFQIIKQKQSTVLLDTAHNIDALQNLLLGIRLLNYQQPFKNIFFIVSAYNNELNPHEFIKTIRYFFKKNPGTLTLCLPTTDNLSIKTSSWNIDKFLTSAHHAKIKVTTYENFQVAFHSVSKQLHDPQDLLVITGSHTIISEYWNQKN
ncbi:MAG: hypothetical protein CL947_03170 [Epsilonproteobacteria bacterium]|nr:hypothetical protein [Campylobacterota bacterium]|tara:strand:- start:2111 stop:3496 length:1386 start_codon:yes stop_codon:yes gene_type:complete